MGAAAASIAEDVAVDLDGNLVAAGQLSITDADTGEAAFQAAIVSGTYGSLDIDASGAWTYTADNDRADIQGLGAGDTLTDTITVLSADGTEQDINITIDGSNDAPTIGGVAFGAVQEDQNVVDGSLTVEGSLSITDADTGEAGSRLERSLERMALWILMLRAPGRTRRITALKRYKAWALMRI